MLLLPRLGSLQENPDELLYFTYPQILLTDFSMFHMPLFYNSGNPSTFSTHSQPLSPTEAHSSKANTHPTTSRANPRTASTVSLHP